LHPGCTVTIKQVTKPYGAFRKATSVETPTKDFCNTGIFPLDQTFFKLDVKEIKVKERCE
jgi:hypothetical protein